MSQSKEPSAGRAQVVWADLSVGVYLAALCAALAWIGARKPLWYDELFSWYVVQQDGPTGVLRALLRGADNGLPVDYWIRQQSLWLLGDSELAFRLPSILAYAAGLFCLWSFARRRVSRVAALAALLLPAATASLYYATEGRAYALLLFLQALSLLAWQRTVEAPRSRLWPFLLFLALAASSHTHYFGLLNYLPVIAGEGFRNLREGRWTPRVALPIGFAILPYALVPLFARNALEMKEAFWASNHGLSTLPLSYRWLLGELIWPLAILSLVCLLFLRHRRPSATAQPRGFRAREQVSILALLAAPVVVLAMAILFTNAMTPRYAIVACFGFALLAAHCVEIVRRRSRPVAVIAVGLLFLWSGFGTLRAVRRVAGEGPDATLARLMAGQSLPVLVDSPLRFLQSYHYLSKPARDQLVYLSDRAESRRRLGHDNDEIALENLGAWVPIHTEPYVEFVRREHEFLVLADSSRRWLLARLSEEGAELRSIRRVGELELIRASLGPQPAEAGQSDY